jgi:hypothetical protein
MNNKRATAFLLFLFGEALIITAFVYFGRSLPAAIIALNIAVTSIIYSLYFAGLILPRIDFSDKSQKAVGSLGVRTFFVLFYTVCAIGLMWRFNLYLTTPFDTQLIFQAILFFILCLGMYFASVAAQKTKDVYETESVCRANPDAIRKAANDALLKLKALQDAPQDVVLRLSEFQENLRFISPANDDEAANLETDLLSEINNLGNYIRQNPFDHDKIIATLKTCELIYQQRKQIYAH